MTTDSIIYEGAIPSTTDGATIDISEGATLNPEIPPDATKDLQVGDLVETPNGRGFVYKMYDDGTHKASIRHIGANSSDWAVFVRDNNYWGADCEKGYLKMLAPFGLGYSPIPYSCALNDDVLRVADYNGGVIEPNKRKTVIYEKEIYNILDFVDSTTLKIKNGAERIVNIRDCLIFKTASDCKKVFDFFQKEWQEEKRKQRELEEKAGFKVGDFVKIITKDLTVFHYYPPFEYGEVTNLYDDFCNVGLPSQGNFKYPVKFCKKTTKKTYEKKLEEYKLQQVIDRIARNLQATATQEQRGINELTLAIARKMREKNDIFKKLVVLKKDQGATAKILQKKIDDAIEALQKDSRIERVEKRSDFEIVITTQNQYIDRVVEAYTGDEIDYTGEFLTGALNIGKFGIIIDLLNATVNAKRTSDIDGLYGNHPHIDSSICWGNMQNEIKDAIADFEILPIVDVLLEIIHVVRLGDTLINFKDFWSDCPDWYYDEDNQEIYFD